MKQKSFISKLALALLLFVHHSAFSKELLIEYRYGNQIFSSILNVFTDGSSELVEGTNWKPETHKKFIVRSLVLKKLLGLISRVDVARVTETVGEPTTMGSQSGALSVHRRVARSPMEKVELRQIIRAEATKPRPHNRDLRNVSPTALQLEAWVLKQVKYRMPTRGKKCEARVAKNDEN